MKLSSIKKFLSIIVFSVLFIWIANANIENWSFEDYELLKDNKTWKMVKLKGWTNLEITKLDKSREVNFDIYEEVWAEVWENRWRYTRYWNHQLELDSYWARAWDKHVDAIYQKFIAEQDWTLIFNMYWRKAWTSDVEIYIDGKYKETITPSNKYITYMYDFKAWNHSIMFKEVNEQDDWLWAVIDWVKFLTDMRKIEAYNNGISQKAVKVITNDQWLKANTTYDDIYDWAEYANEMGNLIYTEIKKLGYMDDAKFDSEEMKSFNTHMFNNFHEKMMELHWDDEKWEETGFHLVQNDWATTKLGIPWIKNERNAVNTIWDGIFHFGLYATVNEKRILNEDGNQNQTWVDLAKYMNFCLNWELSEIKEQLEKNVWMSVKSGEFLGYENKTISWTNSKWTWVAVFKNKSITSNSVVNFIMKTWLESPYQNWFLVFDYKYEKNFKFVWSRDWADYWTIWEFINWKYKDKVNLKENIDSLKDYNITVSFNWTEVSLLVDWNSKLIYNFDTKFNSTIWYAVEKASTNFSNINISTNSNTSVNWGGR